MAHQDNSAELGDPTLNYAATGQDNPSRDECNLDTHNPRDWGNDPLGTHPTWEEYLDPKNPYHKLDLRQGTE